MRCRWAEIVLISEHNAAVDKKKRENSVTPKIQERQIKKITTNQEESTSVEPVPLQASAPGMVQTGPGTTVEVPIQMREEVLREAAPEQTPFRIQDADELC